MVEAVEFLDAGNRVVVLTRLVGRGAGSGVDVDAEIAHVALVQGGRISRFVGYASRADALEAVGLGD